MKFFLLLFLFLIACGRSPTYSLGDGVAQTQAAIKERDAAIKTSAEAKQAAQQARAQAEQYQDLASQATAESRRLDRLANELRQQEIAGQISRVSWWLSGIGVLTLGIGIFLILRIGGKTALALALGGACSLALGIVGLLIAPHWIAWAWGGAIVLGIGLVGGLFYLLRHHSEANLEMVQGIQSIKDRFFPIHPDGTVPRMRMEVNEILSKQNKNTQNIVKKLKGKVPQRSSPTKEKDL